jgi:hypothetical protein
LKFEGGGGLSLSIGLILRFRLNPSPRCFNYAYHGLPAGMNVHVFYRDLLLALPRWRFSASSNMAKVRESLLACSRLV